MKKIFPFESPLNEGDSENQTFGCRKNPDICQNNGLPNICAFTREDCICKKPSKSWKKQFLKLQEKQSK